MWISCFSRLMRGEKSGGWLILKTLTVSLWFLTIKKKLAVCINDETVLITHF